MKFVVSFRLQYILCAYLVLFDIYCSLVNDKLSQQYLNFDCDEKCIKIFYPFMPIWIMCQVTWEEGLATTFAWYQKNSARFGNIEPALEAHPRAGLDKECEF